MITMLCVIVIVIVIHKYVNKVHRNCKESKGHGGIGGLLFIH